MESRGPKILKTGIMVDIAGVVTEYSNY